ncbi:MAG: lipoprotein [Gammaproteobacteria bacterium]|nr:lipoprotein [Gammaproteobacteria bacterium]MBU1731108.1 lipoprotein [Gammaproteobacteria bacterium]MBU1894172.1 lipoprotein [Gammaproteobacteria bacterium]
MRPVLMLVLCGLLLAGCGHKGPLYLPQPSSEQQDHK